MRLWRPDHKGSSHKQPKRKGESNDHTGPAPSTLRGLLKPFNGIGGQISASSKETELRIPQRNKSLPHERTWCRCCPGAPLHRLCRSEWSGGGGGGTALALLYSQAGGKTEGERTLDSGSVPAPHGHRIGVEEQQRQTGPRSGPQRSRLEAPGLPACWDVNDKHTPSPGGRLIRTGQHKSYFTHDGTNALQTSSGQQNLKSTGQASTASRLEDVPCSVLTDGEPLGPEPF